MNRRPGELMVTSFLVLSWLHQNSLELSWTLLDPSTTFIVVLLGSPEPADAPRGSPGALLGSPKYDHFLSKLKPTCFHPQTATLDQKLKPALGSFFEARFWPQDMLFLIRYILLGKGEARFGLKN